MRTIKLASLLVVAALVMSACGTISVSVAPTTTTLPAATATVVPSATAIPTPEPTPTAVAYTNEEIAEQLRPSTVHIVAEFGETAIDSEMIGAGTGIVYDLDNGYIVTNAHVVEGSASVKITPAASSKTRPARIIGRSQCDDLAVLKIENTDGLQAATLGDSDSMKVGAEVAVLGYPLELESGADLSINAGNISQLKTQLDQFEELIKTDAAMNPGNSGGPLVNRRGEVIGISVGTIADAQNQNYAIAISQARAIIEQLEQGQNLHYLGLNLVPNAYSDYFGIEEGMAVIGVASGSPAARVGLQPADLLLKIENSSVQSQSAVCNILRSRGDGDQLKLTVFRKSTCELLEGEITLGKTVPASGSTPKLAVVNSQACDEQTSDEQASNVTTVVENTFDDGDVGSWFLGEREGYSSSVQDGHYVVNVVDTTIGAVYSPAEATSLADGVIGTRVLIEGEGDAGLMVRDNEVGDSNSKYLCVVNNNGKFACYKQIDNTWTTLVDLTSHDSIRRNDYNELFFFAVGSQLSFMINEQVVATFSDDSLSQGAWGVYLDTPKSPTTARYDEIFVGTSK